MDHVIQIAGGDQLLTTVALDATGVPARPSVATYKIVDLRVREDDDDRIVAEGSATIDAAAAALGEAAGRGTADPQRLAITSAPTGFVSGGRYLIRDRVYREQVVVEAIEASDDSGVLRISSPLTMRYGVGATIEGLVVAATFPAAAAAEPPDDALLAIDWSFGAALRATRELIRFGRASRVRFGSIEGAQAIDQGLGSFVGDRRRIAIALSQANREILAELAIAGEAQLELGDVGDLAAEYFALSLLYMSIPSQAALAKWARDRADYFIENVKRGDKPRGVHEIEPRTDTAATPRRRGLFKSPGPTP